MTPDEHLRELWRELRNDASPSKSDAVKAAVDALYAVGILSTEQCELWTRRLATCPGHDDEGGRSWCAFCGPMKGDAPR